MDSQKPNPQTRHSKLSQALYECLIVSLSVCFLLQAPRVDASTNQQQAAPKLVDIAREYTHLEGSNVTLVCSISSGNTESLSYEWLKDDILINSMLGDTSMFPASVSLLSAPQRVKVEVLPNKEHATLKITDLNESDGARYTCIARNPFGQDKISTKLRVKVPLKWVKEPQGVKVAIGKSLRIPCQALGNPAPTIRWQRLNSPNFKQVNHMQADRQQSTRTNQLIETFGQTDLKFSSVSLQDSGLYECTASNGNDDDLSSIIQIDVVGK